MGRLCCQIRLVMEVEGEGGLCLLISLLLR